MISRYPATERIWGIIHINSFEPNVWIDIDEEKWFLWSLQTLFKKTIFPNVLHYLENENVEYADSIMSSKNVYLSSTIIIAENVLYSYSIKDGSSNVFNSVMVGNSSENIYFSHGILRSFNIFYSKFIDNCNNVWFSTNLTNCSHCIDCKDLEHKSYCINNIEYSKEEYELKKKEILDDKNAYFQRFLNLDKLWKNKWSENVQGSFVLKSQDVSGGLLSYQVIKWNNVVGTGGSGENENMYDVVSAGSISNDGFYGAVSTWGNSTHVYNCMNITWSSNIYYSVYLSNCSFCLWCIGLKNKSYCILNKQYTREEWYQKVNEIFKTMEVSGILGKFFPGIMNPYYFKDTMAYLIDDSFTKEEIEQEGYLWRDDVMKADIPSNADVISNKDLQHYQGYDMNGKWSINPIILKKVIQDEKGNMYRIIPMELQFLQKHELPLPEIHRLDRIKLGFRS